MPQVSEAVEAQGDLRRTVLWGIQWGQLDGLAGSSISLRTGLTQKAGAFRGPDLPTARPSEPVWLALWAGRYLAKTLPEKLEIPSTLFFWWVATLLLVDGHSSPGGLSLFFWWLATLLLVACHLDIVPTHYVKPSKGW